MPYTYDHPHPAVTVDIAAFTLVRRRLRLLLIRRGREPFAGRWALPGGFVDPEEDLPDAARRELAEETGITSRTLDQFGAFGRPGRDPRGRTITIGFLAALPERSTAARAGDDASDAEWFDLESLPALAFDHAELIACARRRLPIAVEHGTIGFDLLPAQFDAEALADMHAAVTGRAPPAGTLVGTLLATGSIEPAGTSGLYRAARAPAAC